MKAIHHPLTTKKKKRSKSKQKSKSIRHCDTTPKEKRGSSADSLNRHVLREKLELNTEDLRVPRKKKSKKRKSEGSHSKPSKKP